jgi:hypothetical protein
VTPRIGAIIGVLLLVLLVVLVITAPGAPQEHGFLKSYASTDAAPGGTLALRRWVERLGYPTRSVQGPRFAIPPQVQLLFVLGPLEPVNGDDAELLLNWASAGHTLVVASDRAVTDAALFGAFGARLVPRRPAALDGSLSPVLAHPPLRDLKSQTGRALAMNGPGVVLVGDGENALLVARKVGASTVLLSSAPDMLANGGLLAGQNDRLVLNLLAGLKAGQVVGFDEYHHGAHTDPSASGLVLGTWPGRALLLAGLAIFLYVAMRGRRFGRPLPVEERPARSSLDYIRSFAALLRRSRAQILVGERLARTYRRRFARALGLTGAPNANELVEAWDKIDAGRAERARGILAALDRPLPEGELLAVVGRAEALAGEVERR